MSRLQIAFRLITLFLIFLLPFKPSLAQDQPETESPSFELPFRQAPQFNLPADFRFVSSSVPINLVPDAAPPKEKPILPANACSSPFPTGPLSVCLTAPLPNSSTLKYRFDFYPIKPIQPTARPTESFHWKAAFWQSFGFLVAGHAFRLANDKGARYLLIHKPFWHDYWASANNFHMSRWGDGDSFLVNYIGHPMEGAVYGDIFLNNDPVGRTARFGKSSNYWYSRLRAMAWATVWEAYFEIGPVLSETAIGNEGGHTYYPGCGRSPCAKGTKPGTNNTGWVDFVITPVVGMGWIVMEDAIEREFVDRLAKGSPALKYKILRGSLAPSRTFANMFAGKTPWFRYTDEGSFTQTFGNSLHPSARPLWKDEPRYSLSAQFISMNLSLDRESCGNCKQFLPGYGFDFNYRFAKYAYFNSAVNLFPGSGAHGQHGGAQESLVGVKLGRTLGNWGLFTNVRNGFIHYDKTLIPGSSSAYESTWRYALDLGGTVEFNASSHSSLRLNAGTTLVHYLEGYTDPNQPPTSVLSTQYYSLRGSPYITTGYVLRF